MSQFWNLTGNSPLPTDFLGTFSPDPLRIRTDDIQRMFIRPDAGLLSGFVGLGDFFDLPLQRLHVLGDINLETDIFTRTAFNDGYRINDSTVLQIKNNDNLFIGWGAGASWVSAGVAQNTFCGNASGFSNTLGSSNCFYGFESGFSNVEGRHNTFLNPPTIIDQLKNLHA
ncbi:hypothetical protein JYT25_00885 [bacterium AH-315-C20]|nr:hypothetical protein [bacterium AH-315-C20]